MNGDDGYVDAGGGGSVWWELGVAEGQVPATELVDTNNGKHTPRKDNFAAYKVSGHDSFTQRKAGDIVNGKELQPTDVPSDQAPAFFVVSIEDARKISRIEVVGDTLRVYFPVNDPPDPLPANKRGPKQFSVRWGLRNLPTSSVWAEFKAALTGAGAETVSAEGQSV